MSVPNAFIMPACPRRAPRRRRAASSAGPTTTGASAVADPLDQVGEVARGVRPADRQRARRGIVERDRVRRHRLDLPRQHLGREIRPAGSSARRRPWSFRARWRSGDRRSPRRTGSGSPGGRRRSARRWSRRPPGRSPDARRRACPACPRYRSSARRECRARHIALRTRSISSGRHCWTTCSRRRSDGSSMPSPSGTTSPSTVAPWLPPVTRIFSGANSSNGGNGSSPSRAISSRTGLPTSTALLADSAASAGRPGHRRCRSPSASPASSRLTRPSTAFCS